MNLPKSFTLANGVKMPSIGLGTWRSPKSQVRDAVRVALQSGYRHLDCAWRYENEEEVAQGIKDSGVPRKDIFITSKLWNSFHNPHHVQPALEDTLRKLDTDYLDLYLMHWPVAFQAPAQGTPESKPTDKDGNVLVDFELTEHPQRTWAEMEKLQSSGKVASLGISNFNRRRTRQILDGASIRPLVNQCEIRFGYPQKDFVNWSRSHDILMQAYSPLGSAGAPETQDLFIVDMASKYNTQPASILISWQLARGVCPLPKSVTADRIKANLEIVSLTEEDFRALEQEASSRPQTRISPGGYGGLDVFEDDKDSLVS